MSTKRVPRDILSAINKSVKDYWGDDADMIAYTVEAEMEAYLAMQRIEFGGAATVQQEIVNYALESADNWEERLSLVESEVAAFEELQIGFDDVPSALVQSLKAEAAQDTSADYSSQRDAVMYGINIYRQKEQLQAQIGPIAELLIAMERIIGNECYNSNIQNYSAGGVWEGEGRSFRYPVEFANGDEIIKRRLVADIAPEVLITGRYRFGSNELGVFRALAKIVDMIEQDYGVRLADAKKKT